MYRRLHKTDRSTHEKDRLLVRSIYVITVGALLSVNCCTLVSSSAMLTSAFRVTSVGLSNASVT